MARRRGGVKVKRALEKKDFNRKAEGINQVVGVLVACEDEISSVTYLKMILDDLKRLKLITNFSCVIARHKHSDPEGVLDDLLSHRESNGMTVDDYEYKWIVIDRDNQWAAGEGHQSHNFVQAVHSAKKGGVDVAYSNDAFELWYLLHFYDIQNTETRAGLNRKLLDKAAELGVQETNIKSEAFAREIYPYLIDGDRECEAIRRAQALLKYHTEIGSPPEIANPSTTVFKLICLLRSFQLEEDERHCSCESLD